MSIVILILNIIYPCLICHIPITRMENSGTLPIASSLPSSLCISRYSLFFESLFIMLTAFSIFTLFRLTLSKPFYFVSLYVVSLLPIYLAHLSPTNCLRWVFCQSLTQPFNSIPLPTKNKSSILFCLIFLFVLLDSHMNFVVFTLEQNVFRTETWLMLLCTYKNTWPTQGHHSSNCPSFFCIICFLSTGTFPSTNKNLKYTYTTFLIPFFL